MLSDIRKKYLEQFIKSIIKEIIECDIYNDNAPTSAEYPYIVTDSSYMRNDDFPGIKLQLDIDIWDKHPNYESVNLLADKIQDHIDRNSFNDDHVIGTFYLNVRNKVEDADKSLKRVNMTFDADIYYIDKEEK